MTLAHEVTLTVLLGTLGLSLVGPGLVGVFRPSTGQAWLIAPSVDAKNHLRGLNAMMAAVGLVAFWACWDLADARSLVVAPRGADDGPGDRPRGLDLAPTAGPADRPWSICWSRLSWPLPFWSGRRRSRIRLESVS